MKDHTGQLSKQSQEQAGSLGFACAALNLVRWSTVILADTL